MYYGDGGLGSKEERYKWKYKWGGRVFYKIK